MINYTRDSNSNAVLNMDAAALNKYKVEKKLHKRVASLTKELESVKSKLDLVCEKLEELEIK